MFGWPIPNSGGEMKWSEMLAFHESFMKISWRKGVDLMKWMPCKMWIWNVFFFFFHDHSGLAVSSTWGEDSFWTRFPGWCCSASGGGSPLYSTGRHCNGIWTWPLGRWSLSPNPTNTHSDEASDPEWELWPILSKKTKREKNKTKILYETIER